MPYEPYPLGALTPECMIKQYPAECSLIGALVILWGAFDGELCHLLNQLLKFQDTDGVDPRTRALFYSTTNAKARRDLLQSVAHQVQDDECRKWISRAIEKGGSASDLRNAVIHSEYFLDMADGHLKMTTPARPKQETIRHGIQQQANAAIDALIEAEQYLFIAHAAIEGKERLEEELGRRPALKEKHAPQPPQSQRKDSP